MTLLSPIQLLQRDVMSKEQPLNQCENIEQLLSEITNELNQTEWIGVTNHLRIDPDKLHLVSIANGCDLHRQKTLGLLCWIEDVAKEATFEKLVGALQQVRAKNLAGDVKNYSRLLRIRKAHSMRKVDSLHTQYYAMQFTQYPQLPKSALYNNQWRFTELPHPHFMHGSPSAAFYPSKSVPTHSTFDLTSSVSIQGAKLNLIHRDTWATKPHMKKGNRPSTIAGMPTAGRKRALGTHRKSGQVEISTSIKTAVPLNNAFHGCHPEEIQDRIADKLFDYLLNGNGSREVLGMVSSLETIDGLVVKKLRKGSLKIEANLLKSAALKVLWRHYETGQLNDMFQEKLISENSLKMAGAFSISLETSIDQNDLQLCLQQFQGQNSRNLPGIGLGGKSAILPGKRNLSPPRTRFSCRSGPRSSSLASHEISQHCRVTTVPASRSVMVDLSPSVRVVKPEPRGLSWKTDKGRLPARYEMKPTAIYSDPTEMDELSHKPVQDFITEAKDTASQVVPPPSPDLPDEQAEDEVPAYDEENIRKALEDLNKRTNEVELDFKQFDPTLLRKLVDSLKNASELGIEKINHLGDLRKYATILRQNDAADTAQLVEQFVKVTESLDQIHHDVTSKIWLKVSENTSASAKSRDASGNHRRSPLRNQVTQSIEIWRQMQDPKYDFTNLDTDQQLQETFSAEELSDYGGLLSHIPALLSSAKTCHQLLNHYMHAP